MDEVNLRQDIFEVNEERGRHPVLFAIEFLGYSIIERLRELYDASMGRTVSLRTGIGSLTYRLCN